MESPDLHPMASAHVPSYLPGADGSDPLFTAVAVFTIGLIILIGGFYFTLHSLPERMAHHGNHTQFQVIGILALLALFTHNNVFWVAALLLAAFRMPDFLTPLQSISDSLMAIYSRLPVAQQTPHAEAAAPAAAPEPARSTAQATPDAAPPTAQTPDPAPGDGRDV
ncbi:hypothetical protein SAMN05444007_101469 [Cribrihabitans marinus]|uniref:Uncharacterized protein n=1 Tax=Cribrihabitans marinus TaxID=1227549 RepID=A0A1H6RMS3_9RHOB|nr:hypothetical protein GCM10010973_05110 [Cribrihabitans marinus]SEI53110.1 hypothetical protein SAMN05444007_101469 [Cribrihabitans marinus]